MKRFTLLELVTAVIILSFLAVIILINIKDSKYDAHIASIKGNIHSLQIASDSYSNKFFKLPTTEELSLGNPSSINYDLLDPKFIKSLPDLSNAYYWLDSDGTVWGSTVDAPTAIKLVNSTSVSSFSLIQKAYANDNSKILVWDKVPYAERYLIYKLRGNEQKLEKIGETTKNEFSIAVNDSEIKDFFVAATDKNGLETPPVNNLYIGFNAIKPNAEILSNIEKDSSHSISKKITFSAKTDIENYTEEWVFNGKSINLKEDIPVVKIGENLMELRIISEAGVKSDWVGFKFNGINVPPLVSLSLLNSDKINPYVAPVFTKSYNDIEGEKEPIEQEFYLNDVKVSFDSLSKKYAEGNYQVKYRAKDSFGNWSELFILNFKIVDLPPIVTLELVTQGELTNATNISFKTTFKDPEGITKAAKYEYLVNGISKTTINGYYNRGTHTIKYRVQDSSGVWSEYVSLKISVSSISSSDFYWRYSPASGVFGKLNAIGLIERRSCPCGNSGSLHLQYGKGTINVTIKGAGYGASGFGYTPSYEAGKVSNYRVTTINATIGLDGYYGFTTSFQYGDSFVHILSIEPNVSSYIN